MLSYNMCLRIFRNFSADVDKYKFEEDNPFIEDSDDSEDEGGEGGKKASKSDRVASVGYRYRKWDLGNGIKLVAR